MHPLIDVVVLSWNRLEHTLQAIESVLTQADVETRIWIIDQGSEATCKATLRELAQNDLGISLSELDQNVGVAAGRNLGMSMGSAECIVCIDNDAVFEDSNALALIAARFQDDPLLGAIGFRITESQTGSDDLASWGYPRNLLEKSESEFLATRFVGAGHALRRSALAKTAGYDESLFFYWEELDLSYQLIEAGYHILYDPAIEIRHLASPAMRAYWQETRYYYLVRNAIYVDYKYFRSPARTMAQAFGYLIKGAYNRIVSKAARGVVDGIKMIGGLPEDGVRKLSPATLAYLQENDLRYRGNLCNRFSQEIWIRLPGMGGT